MFNRILVAIDNSEPAYAALDVATGLAAALGATLAVVHVVDDSRAFRAELGFIDQSLLSALRRGGAEVLELACTRLPASMRVEQLLSEGEPSERIVATARQWRADLIIIGSDSRGRLAHFLLGSTADSVIRRAPCPVVAVRAKEQGVRRVEPEPEHEAAARG
jgi:nucleotide-binding universal stress UspA family protein